MHDPQLLPLIGARVHLVPVSPCARLSPALSQPPPPGPHTASKASRHSLSPPCAPLVRLLIVTYTNTNINIIVTTTLPTAINPPHVSKYCYDQPLSVDKCCNISDQFHIINRYTQDLYQCALRKLHCAHHVPPTLCQGCRDLHTAALSAVTAENRQLPFSTPPPLPPLLPSPLSYYHCVLPTIQALILILPRAHCSTCPFTTVGLLML